MVSLARYQTVLRDVVVRVVSGDKDGRPLYETAQEAAPGTWLRPDRYGRIRLSGIPVASEGGIAVFVRAADGGIFRDGCTLAPERNGYAHVLVAPAIEVSKHVQTYVDVRELTYKVDAPIEVLTAIRVTSPTDIPPTGG